MVNKNAKRISGYRFVVYSLSSFLLLNILKKGYPGNLSFAYYRPKRSKDMF